MRPHEEIKRKVMAEWVRKADADFDLAEHLLAEGSNFLNAIAFHCQQHCEMNI